MRLTVLGFAFALAGSAATAVAADKPDSQTEDRVEARLNQDARLKGQSVSVDVDNGVATLKGKVASEADRARAERLAHVSGVTRVDNKIEIDKGVAKDKIERNADKAKERIDDNAARAKERVDENAAAAKNRVDDKGVPKADNSGAAPVERHGDSAGNAISDSWITTKVKSQFATADGLKGTDLSVDTSHDGVVTLTGTAPTEAARHKAIELARTTRGVTRVVDEIKVQK
jgi:hyperosmotically inducible protein